MICYIACMCLQQKAKKEMGMSMKYEKRAWRLCSKFEKFCAYLPPTFWFLSVPATLAICYLDFSVTFCLSTSFFVFFIFLLLSGTAAKSSKIIFSLAQN